MREFVEQCRREWSRLGVPESVANEMAADLTADLDEAEAEGASPEEVLGNGVFDPQSFAASWAAARGVIGPTPVETRFFRRAPIPVLVTAAMAVLTILSALALLTRQSAGVVAFAARRVTQVVPVPPTPPRLPAFKFIRGPGQFAIQQRFGNPDINSVAWILLVIGIVGMVLAVLYWSPWTRSRRSSFWPGRTGTPRY